MNNVVIDLPFALSDLDKLFKIVDFLEDKEYFLKKFKSEVAKYKAREGYFKSNIHKSAYKRSFRVLIKSLIKRELAAHFEVDPEELLLLTDDNFLDMFLDNSLMLIETYK